MNSEERRLKELQEFEAWFKCVSYEIIPLKDDVPPKHYIKYKEIAFAAWQELSCRQRIQSHAS